MENKKEYTLFWFIENYSYCWHKTGEKLTSPVFTIDGLEGTSWYLGVYPRGLNDKNQGWIVIDLGRRKGNGPSMFTVTYNLSIVAENGSTNFSNEYTSEFSESVAFGWPLVEMGEILSQRSAEYLPQDTLTVRCKLWIGKGSADTIETMWARTRIRVGHISFLHAIEGFSALEPNQRKTCQIYSHTQKGQVESSVYKCDGSGWEDMVVVEIAPSSSNRILGKCEIYLLEASGKKLKCADADNRFDANRKEIRKMSLSLTKNAILSKKSKYLPDDKLSVVCECVFSIGIEFQKIEGVQNALTSTVEKLIRHNSSDRHASLSTEKLSAFNSVGDDLKDILSSQFLSDVKVQTEANSFPAHKVVLCARSPVFKVMMSNDMKEKNSGSIQVDDLDDDIVEKLLLFLYADRLENLQWETATKLYYAADKYEIEKLRLLCSSFLISKLTAPTATELLVLSDTHNDNNLRKVVENFILEHDDEVFISNGWKELMGKNPQLALKTMHLKYET